MLSIEQIKSYILETYGIFCDERNLYHDSYKSYINKTGLWQQPDEIANLIYFLQDKNIKTFLDIGTFNGSTMHCISSLINSITTIISIDPNKHELTFINDNALYIQTTSDYLKHLKFDLVFIDGDHSYEHTKNDFFNVGRFAKYCVFHDIDDSFIKERLDGGCTRFWNEIKNSYIHLEFIADNKPIKNMGIGILLLD